MKKVIFFSLAIMAIFLFSSCQQPIQQKTTTTVTTEMVSYSNQGFYVEQRTIVKGNTVWGISREKYGTGLLWRDIVAQNPFLNSPGRIYYNDSTKMWIVRIYPGEVLNIAGQKVNPSCTYQSTTTTTTTKPVVSATHSSPWGWWLCALIPTALLVWFFVWLAYFHRPNVANFTPANQAVHVNIQNGIDLDTCKTLLNNEKELCEKTLKMIRRGAKKGTLKEFFLATDSEGFIVEGSFRNKKDKKKNKQEDKEE